MQEQMGNERTTLGNLRKNEREMLEIKNIVREMKNAFERLINKLDMAEQNISEFEEMSIDTSRTEN